MRTFTQHDSARCPECGEPLYFGMKEETSGWKVYYDCECGWERMTGRIPMSEVEYRDEVHERARKMGERWARP